MAAGMTVLSLTDLQRLRRGHVEMRALSVASLISYFNNVPHAKMLRTTPTGTEILAEEIAKVLASSAHRRAAARETGPLLPVNKPLTQQEFDMAWLVWEQDALVRDKPLHPNERVQNRTTRTHHYHTALLRRIDEAHDTSNSRLTDRLGPMQEAEESLREAITATSGSARSQFSRN